MNTFFYNFSFLFFVFRENITTLQSDNVIPAASVGRLTKVSATKKNFQFRQKKELKTCFFLTALWSSPIPHVRTSLIGFPFFLFSLERFQTAFGDVKHRWNDIRNEAKSKLVGRASNLFLADRVLPRQTPRGFETSFCR